MALVGFLPDPKHRRKEADGSRPDLERESKIPGRTCEPGFSLRVRRSLNNCGASQLESARRPVYAVRDMSSPKNPPKPDLARPTPDFVRDGPKPRVGENVDKLIDQVNRSKQKPPAKKD